MSLMELKQETLDTWRYISSVQTSSQRMMSMRPFELYILMFAIAIPLVTFGIYAIVGGISGTPFDETNSAFLELAPLMIPLPLLALLTCQIINYFVSKKLNIRIFDALSDTGIQRYKVTVTRQKWSTIWPFILDTNGMPRLSATELCAETLERFNKLYGKKMRIEQFNGFEYADRDGVLRNGFFLAQDGAVYLYDSNCLELARPARLVPAKKGIGSWKGKLSRRRKAVWPFST